MSGLSLSLSLSRVYRWRVFWRATRRHVDEYVGRLSLSLSLSRTRIFKRLNKLPVGVRSQRTKRKADTCELGTQVRLEGDAPVDELVLESCKAIAEAPTVADVLQLTRKARLHGASARYDSTHIYIYIYIYP